MRLTECLPKISMVLIVVAGLSLNCGMNATENSAGHDESVESAKPDFIELSEQSQSLINLATVPVTKEDMHSTISATGKVNAHPNKIAYVGPVLSGRVSRLFVNSGQVVKKNQALIEIESVELGEAKSNFFSQKTNFELARRKCERLNKLFEKQIGSQKEVIAAEGELKVAESGFIAAEKQLHLMGLSEDDVHALTHESHEIDIAVSLKSPIPGTVVERNAVLGEMVNDESMLIKIVDMNLLCVVAEIYEADIARVKTGQKVRISVTAFPDETFEGTVNFISSTFNEETRTVPIRIAVQNRNQLLKIGMFANVEIYTDINRMGIAVPANAVLEDERSRVVFVREDGGFARREVTTGVEFNGHIEIIDGVEVGEDVVTNGNFQLLSELHGKTLSASHSH